jgi:hypothetical protein
MANALDFFSLPMSAGPRDIAVGMDELGRPVRRTVLGREYRQAPPAVAEMQGPPPPPKRSPFVRALMPAGNWNALFQGAMEGVTAPGRAARGEPVTYGDVAATALDWGVMAAPVGAATMPDNALGIFAGRRGANPRQLDDLARAEVLEAAGKSRDDIWRETGWGRGVDGKWRFEIDDSAIRLTTPEETDAVALQMRQDARDIMSGIDQRNAALREQPDLFPADLRRAHGDLRRQAGELRREAGSNFGPEWNHAGAGQRAYYAVSGPLADVYPDAMRETIVRTQQAPAGYAGSYNGARAQLDVTRAATDERSTLLHELQHMTQGVEGFARGSNPTEGVRIARERVSGASLRAYDEMQDAVRRAPAEIQDGFARFELDPDAPFAREAFANMGPDARRILQKWDQSDALARAGANVNDANAMAFYRRSAGEVESRNTQARADFTPEQRRAIPPWKTADTPESAQIVSFGDGPQASVAETPAQEVARLLREGRADEVTDDMLARFGPNDEMEMFRLYDEGATGAPMPMDEASRMARAEGMGFDTDAYRGTTGNEVATRRAEYGAMGPGVYLGDSVVASAGYAGDLDWGDVGGNMMPLKARGPFAGNMKWTDYGMDETAAVADGFTGVHDTMFEDAFSVFDPRNIRSRFARFDPRLSHLRNLSAGLGAVGVGSLATQPAEAGTPEIQKYLDRYGPETTAAMLGVSVDDMNARFGPR